MTGFQTDATLCPATTGFNGCIATTSARLAQYTSLPKTAATFVLKLASVNMIRGMVSLRHRARFSPLDEGLWALLLLSSVDHDNSAN